eukprot:m51a1_g9793 hypothetical protein (118) ;mRNA; f:1761681-1762156
MLFESPLVAPLPVRSARRPHVLPACAYARPEGCEAPQDSELREILRSCSREAAGGLGLGGAGLPSPDIERCCNPMAQHLDQRHGAAWATPRSRPLDDDALCEAGAQLGLLSLSPAMP